MKGLRMAIAKHTVTTILDTLGENDFMNIIAYNDYVHYIEPCFKGILVQADRDNREHFKQLVDELMVKGVGIVSQALIEAFQILNQFQESRQGSLCNQAIMLITDGAVEDYEPVFEKYNWPDRKVRVFTYLIGREVTFADRMKWIACNNKGYYTQISTLADAQENVMEYLHVLSRPMVINHDHDIIWTEAYMDNRLFTSEAQSLMLLTTVAMPVFSKKNETRSHGILLGVVGSDVTLRELMKLAPRYKLGVHGYAFLNTNNGYILSHPDLRPLYREGQKLRPKPNYNSVDLSEVEWEDQAETLRTAMINGETGSHSMDVKVPLDKGKRVLFLTNDYFFTDISDTPFRIYCITDIDPDHRKLSQLEAVVQFLTRDGSRPECDEELVREVLFDAVVTAPMEAYWTALALNMTEYELAMWVLIKVSPGTSLTAGHGQEMNQVDQQPPVTPKEDANKTNGTQRPLERAHETRIGASEPGVDVAFLGTRAGLLRRSLFVGSEKISDRKFLTPEDEASIFTMDHFPLWYRQASEQAPGSFVFNLRWEEGPDSPDEPVAVRASTAIAVTVDGKTAIAAGRRYPEPLWWVKAVSRPLETPSSGIGPPAKRGRKTVALPRGSYDPEWQSVPSVCQPENNLESSPETPSAHPC
ncbi:hypothetical protein STEG23_030555 [Scotinomys teguina]